MPWPSGAVMLDDPYPPDILQDEGLCNKLKVKDKLKIFYPEDGQNYREAVALCLDCPVRKECAEWAIQHYEYGCWGGLTEQNRKIIRKNKSWPLPWPTGLHHGQGRKAFSAHLHRGEIPCDDCYKGKPNHGSTLNRKAKNGKANENGHCIT